MPLPIHILARGILLSDDNILLCRNPKTGRIYLPGGHVEPGESAGDALLRELHEELSLTQATLGAYLGLIEYRFPNHQATCHDHEYNLLFAVHKHGLTHTLTPNSNEPLSVTFLWHPLDPPCPSLQPACLQDLLHTWIHPSPQNFHSSIKG